MKLTDIFKFKQPDGSDVVNIQDINGNFDTVETVLKRVDEAQAGTKNTPAAGTASRSWTGPPAMPRS